MILSADRVVLPSGSVEPGWVETGGERITYRLFAKEGQ